MPLTQFDDYCRESGVDVMFRMKDGDKLVVCKVSLEALADYTHSSGRQALDLFEANRDLVERAASQVYDAGESFDQEGRVLVTLAALSRASRT